MQVAERSAVGRWWRGGWRVVARKEFADHLRSVRFVILAALMAVAGLAAIYAATGGIRDAADQATGTPALFLRVFSVAPDRVPSFLVLVGLLGPLLGIAFGFDAINGERTAGTLPRLLSQPIYRDDVINGKFVAGIATIGLVLGALLVFVASVGLLRIGVVPSLSDLVRLAVYFVVTLIYIGFWLAFAMVCSVWLRRAATSALASIATWLVLTLFASLLVGIVAGVIAPAPADATVDEQIRNAQMEQTLSRLSPSTLYEEATLVLLNPQIRTLGLLFPEQVDRAIPSPLSLDQSLLVAWPQVLGLVALLVVGFAVGYVSFMRQEVRA
jgi:ABC-2 type transport system permease protein